MYIGHAAGIVWYVPGLFFIPHQTIPCKQIAAQFLEYNFITSIGIFLKLFKVMICFIKTNNHHKMMLFMSLSL